MKIGQCILRAPVEESQSEKNRVWGGARKGGGESSGSSPMPPREEKLYASISI